MRWPLASDQGPRAVCRCCASCVRTLGPLARNELFVLFVAVPGKSGCWWLFVFIAAVVFSLSLVVDEVGGVDVAGTDRGRRPLELELRVASGGPAACGENFRLELKSEAKVPVVSAPGGEGGIGDLRSTRSGCPQWEVPRVGTPDTGTHRRCSGWGTRPVPEALRCWGPEWCPDASS
jgi:hypothetical protein